MGIRSLTATSQRGIILASVSGNVQVNEDYKELTALYLFDLSTKKKITELTTYGNANVYQFSRDASLVMTDVKPGGDHIKCLDIFDLTKLKTEGRVELVASLKPETDARFNYLTPDGKMLCLGLAGVSGVIFFELVKNMKKSGDKDEDEDPKSLLV